MSPLASTLYFVLPNSSIVHIGFLRAFFLVSWPLCLNINKACILILFHLLLSSIYLHKHFPSLLSLELIIFLQNLVYCYNLTLFNTRPVFFPFGPFPLTQFLKFHFPLLSNIYPYPQKFPQEFRQPLTPSFPSLYKAVLNPLFCLHQTLISPFN